MASSHLQINHDASIEMRATQLWPSTKGEQKDVIVDIFERTGWFIERIENINGAHWEVIAQCQDEIKQIDLYISSIRDESRQDDEYKMQLGNYYPTDDRDGWVTLILGIYVISENDEQKPEYLLACYNRSRSKYNYGSNPSHRGVRTKGLQKAKMYGFYENDQCCIFKPEMVYYCIDILNNDISTSNEVPTPINISETIKIYSSFLTALRTKPFLLLAGISGTGKSRIVRELAFMSCPSYLQDAEGTTPGNYCMIEVKPNWHDSSELLGYYSNIRRAYVFTKFVKFLVRAMMHPTVPFFVCLDEMNLAPVEQYFAEFLSVLETRKIAKGADNVATGNLVSSEHFTIKSTNPDGSTSVKIPKDCDWFYTFFDKDGINSDEREIIDKHTDQTLSNKGISLPENVFVIGTVNMDDTTHQFSRKVIDRAMTIEMNGGKLEDMFGGSKKLEYPTEPDDKILSMATLKARYISGDDVLEKCSRIKKDAEAVRFVTGRDAAEGEDTLPRRLDAINKILENTPFQVSYRVFNELVIYLAVLCDDAANEDKDIKALADIALDKIALMKILPRIEGDYDMFTDGDKNKLKQLMELFAKDGGSWKKLDEMAKRLDSTEFTRFWP